jgi:Carboxypeptidase regulatory-like domain
MRKQLATLLSVLCLLALPALTQEFRSTISGHVTDASNSAVPNAKVSAVNVDNNETTTATTDGSGAYAIPFLRPGIYKLTASAAGFKQYIQDKLTLEAAKVSGIDIHLEVGGVNESVEVTAEAVALDTQSATRSAIVTTQQVAEMPLNARNPFMLGAMMAGVTFNGAAIWQRPFDNGAIAQWSMNGGRDSSSEFMLDGASNNGQMGGNNVAYVPIVDAVQEFNVMANMYDSQYGHTGGGIMNVVLKSGTNQFHGAAYEYMRRISLDANTFQNNAIAKPKPTHYLDQYGFQVEGPIRVPGLLKKDGAVKLFYMGAFENYREGTPNPLIVSYPEAEMRKGDFSKMVTSAGQPITIYDPFTATYDASGNILTNRTAFPGNIIPANRINPIALAVTQYMPLPNRAAPAGFRYANGNLSLPAYFDADKFYNLILKFDWNFGSKHRAFFRHASNDRTENRANNGIDNKPGTDGQQPFQRINDAYVADWIGTISPTLILNARASYNRFIEKGYGAANAGFDMASLGLPKSLLSQLPSPVYFGVWSFDNYQTLGRSQSNNFTDTYELQLSATKVTGSHTIKAGFDIRQINYEIQNTGNILGFTGNSSWTQRVYNVGESTAGDSYASFLLGLVGGSSAYPLFPWWKQYYYAPYVQDDWKVNRRLTLNLGLRWDFNAPQYEKWNRMNGPFDPNVASPIASQVAANVAALNASGSIPANLAAQYANLSNLKGGITFAGVNGQGRSPFALRKTGFEPRLGFAYQLGEKLVMRGGFGLYHSNPNNDLQRTSGFSTSTNLTNSNDGGRTPIANILSNPFPGGILQPTGSSAGAATFVGQNPSWFDAGFQIPSVWSFSWGFQFQLTKSSTIEASYVGSRSYNLNMNADYNIPSLAVRKTCNYLDGGNAAFCNTQVPNPFKGIPAFNGTSYYTANTVSYYQMTLPFPQFSGTLQQYGRNDSTIKYNSMQINYNLRVRSGLNLVANYTLSKQMEEWGFNDRFNNVYQQGPYTLDRPHVIKLTTIWDLPFGEGKKFGAGSRGVAKRLISGWEITNFFNDALKGFPANLPGNAIMLKDPSKVSGGGYNGSVDWKAYQVREWNPCVLQQNVNTGLIAPTPASIGLGCGTDFSNNWGNYAWLQTTSYAPRYTPYRSGQIRVHHAFQMDASLLKTTRINERMRIQLGFEAFNLLNHNYFGRDNLNTDPTSANFGSVIPSTVSTQNILPRQIQVRFKFNW